MTGSSSSFSPLLICTSYKSASTHDSLSIQGLPEWKLENTIFLANNFRLQSPALRHTGIRCCCFRAEVFLHPVTIKPLFLQENVRK